MDAKRTIEFLNVFGLVIAATAIALLDIGCLYRQDAFANFYQFENRLLHLLAVIGGLTATLAQYEVSSWTGRYGWTRATYRTPSEGLVRWAGFAVLIAATVQILTHSH